jgi:hypothetical protein
VQRPASELPNELFVEFRAALRMCEPLTIGARPGGEKSSGKIGTAAKQQLLDPEF